MASATHVCLMRACCGFWSQLQENKNKNKNIHTLSAAKV